MQGKLQREIQADRVVGLGRGGRGIVRVENGLTGVVIKGVGQINPVSNFPNYGESTIIIVAGQLGTGTR